MDFTKAQQAQEIISKAIIDSKYFGENPKDGDNISELIAGLILGCDAFIASFIPACKDQSLIARHNTLLEVMIAALMENKTDVTTETPQENESK